MNSLWWFLIAIGLMAFGGLMIASDLGMFGLVLIFGGLATLLYGLVINHYEHTRRGR